MLQRCILYTIKLNWAICCDSCQISTPIEISRPTMNILDLSEDALQAILSRLSFDDIAKIRLVRK